MSIEDGSIWETNAIFSQRWLNVLLVDTPCSIWPIMLSRDKFLEILHSLGRSTLFPGSGSTLSWIGALCLAASPFD